MPERLAWLATTLLIGLICLGVSLPLAAAAWRMSRPRGGKAVLVGLAFFFLASLLLAQSASAFYLIRSPWQGMALQGTLALAVILSGRASAAAGLVWRISAQAWRDCALVTGVMLVFTASRAAALHLVGWGSPGGAVGFEFLLYQATLPGIAEELAYRGVIQPRLNSLFGRPWTLFGAQAGWGWVITTVLFWAIHAFRPGIDGGVDFAWQTLTMQLWAGAVFGWVRERSGSVLPAVLSHNLVNLTWTLL